MSVALEETLSGMIFEWAVPLPSGCLNVPAWPLGSLLSSVSLGQALAGSFSSSLCCTVAINTWWGMEKVLEDAKRFSLTQVQLY